MSVRKRAMLFASVVTVLAGTALAAESAVSSAGAARAPAPVAGRLNSVDCVSTGICMAVGGDGSRSLALQLADGHWSEVPAAHYGAEDSLRSVSCPSATNCLAVGSYHVGPPHDEIRALAQHWDGTAWGLLPTEGLPALGSVACGGPSDCIAVSTDRAWHWNGQAWQGMDAPVQPGSQFGSVSCLSPSSCMAVGSDQGPDGVTTFSDRWDGTTWQPVAMASVHRRLNRLEGVSCTSLSSCTAVGFRTPETEVALTATAEQWNGTDWKAEDIPRRGTEQVSTLEGVSCTQQGATATCMAVGYHGRGDAQAWQWNGGAWTSSPVPAPAGYDSSDLTGVSCINGSQCEAVGNYQAGNRSFAMIDSWNGQGWSLTLVSVASRSQ